MFVCVGVGPVSLDLRFVTKGPPKNGLLADITFLAQPTVASLELRIHGPAVLV